MTVILILVLAGVLPDGGMGKISNVLLSIVVIQLISTGVNMFPQLNTYYANLIWGVLADCSSDSWNLFKWKRFENQKNKKGSQLKS